MTTRVAVVLLAASLACGSALAAGDGEAGQRLAEATRLYEQQQHAQAEEAFLQLLRDEGPHPVVLHGLGNAAYRQGDWIGATYAYEWGLRLEPGNVALAENLAQARAHLVADVFPAAESEAAGQARALLARIPGRMTLAIAAVLWSIGWIVLMLRQRERLEGWTWAGVAAILLALPLFVHAGWQRERLGGAPEGILQATEVIVRSGPAREYQDLFELHAGTVVQVLESRGDWRRIRLPNAAEGWVESRDVAVFGDVSTLAPR